MFSMVSRFALQIKCKNRVYIIYIVQFDEWLKMGK